MRDCLWAPPSEGAPEERGCCPAQQWMTPLLSHPPTSLHLQPTHPSIRAAGQSAARAWTCSGGGVSERKGGEGGGLSA